MMVFLVGFMGSGKTTVGRLLAHRLHCPFIDLDDRVESAAACPIQEIFDHRGEAGFRDIEHAQLRAAIEEIRHPPAVLALGGGAFAESRNLALIERRGAVSVWLDAPLDVLAARCARHAADRPLARDPARFRELYQSRLPFYARATLRVDASGTAASVVEEILASLPKVSGA